MAARVTRVAIRDYRSIGSCDVELQPLTLLVGPNGSGKSNFLDALYFLAQGLHAPLEQVLEARFGIRSVLRKPPNGSMKKFFSIRVGFELDDGATGRYSLSIAEGEDGGGVIQEERCEVGKDWFTYSGGSLAHSAGTSPAFTGDRPVLVALGALPQFSPVFNLIAGFRLYTPNPEDMRRPPPPGPGKVLWRAASNAADVLARLQRSKPEATERIRGYLCSLNPEFKDVIVTESGGIRRLAFKSTTGLREFSSSDVSDGTLRAVAILLAIFQAAEGASSVSLVGLEEPESNLHPAAAGILLDALLEASRQVPIIAATHSADLLDRKDLPVSALLAVAIQDGETVIGPVDEPGKSILRKRLYTAGELMRSNQLAPSTNVSRA